MEIQFLENKSILLTGAAGFLAKVVIEKIIRVQPNVKKLYLLLRAEDSSSALHRFNTEVMEKELFKVVREKYGAKLNSFMEEKVCVLSGDITCDWLGLKTSILEELFEKLDFVINLAATTDFDERYDIALRVNTIGAANVLSFSKKCRKLRMLLHVSTAYVCRENEGLILETPINEIEGVDIEEENQIIQQNLQQLQAHAASHNHITSVMRDLGLQRAKKYGWPNTYTFTKAMGEMVLGRFKENIPLVIIRPTMVTSTLKHPFPGWTEGVRTIDSFIVGFGTGRLTCYPGDPQSILDMIPADMVVNAMIASMSSHVDKTTRLIFHVGSSSSNPAPYHQVRDNIVRFFTEQPWFRKDDTPVVVRRPTQLPTRVAARIYMELLYFIPIRILGIVNAASFRYFDRIYLDLSKKANFLLRLVDLFSPYVFFTKIFDDTNAEKLRNAAKETSGDIENEILNFDPRSINWDDYLMHTHIPGLVKYCFRR
ncbi:fatty acyl-CoA reductase 3-like isoform X1 [Salvia hispanica]|uniref:fatty acyl-CoA reductase 3-like isoform X1 n=2 Tax=Salvia hispanica TaxID=49212 RepID=UPI00200911E7|nr:fatty acyl-CoA reductase 3-like isoform X1 [Salvia hispanica]